MREIGIKNGSKSETEDEHEGRREGERMLSSADSLLRAHIG